jgi:hypothetical protein
LRGQSDTVFFFIRKDTSTGDTITVLRPDLSQIMDGKKILAKQPFFRHSRTKGILRNDPPAKKE